MITNDKVTAFFCIIDGFTKNLDTELSKNMKFNQPDGAKRHRNRKGRMYDSEIMTSASMTTLTRPRSGCGMKDTAK